MSETYSGACFCGAVEVEVSGAPVAAGYCHCNDCRSWSASPVNAFSLWKPSDVAVTKGEDQIATFNKTEQSGRKFCRICGGHLMTAHPGMDLIDVYAATIPQYGFTPQLHVFYAQSVLPIRDGLPKYKDIPAELGGSGEMLPE